MDVEIDAGVSADDEDLNAMLMQGVSDSEVARTDESVSRVVESTTSRSAPTNVTTPHSGHFMEAGSVGWNKKTLMSCTSVCLVVIPTE